MPVFDFGVTSVYTQLDVVTKRLIQFSENPSVRVWEIPLFMRELSCAKPVHCRIEVRYSIE